MNNAVKQLFYQGTSLVLTGALTLGLALPVLGAEEVPAQVALTSGATYQVGGSGILSHLGSYATGYSDQNGGVAEIVTYNADNQQCYIVNGKEQTLDIVSLSDLEATGQNQTMVLSKRIDVSQMVPGFVFGDMTSVAVDTIHDRIALALQAVDYSAPGAILLLDYAGNYLAHYEAGVQPDMVTFSPDGNYVLSANEGEPREGYSTSPSVIVIDPPGSVTIVDLMAVPVTTTTSASAIIAPMGVVRTVDFAPWDARRDELVANQVLLKKGLLPSADFEPEYIVVSADNRTAYVALQEANAIATLDLVSGTFTAIDSLGFKDHNQSGNEIDLVKDKAINIKNENFKGVYMPDGIAIYEAQGRTYLLTANEGDASEWGSGDYAYDNMMTVKVAGEKVEVLNPEMMDGLPQAGDAHFILGGRSFAIYEVTPSGLVQVFDSGSDFEKITALAYPDHFNASNKNNKIDSRSDAKGPEPESVAVGIVDGRAYAYIGLERIGGIMLYDITNVDQAFFCDYINTRDFGVDFPKKGTDPGQGDVSVEGIWAVSAADSPTGQPLLLAAHEVSGTVAVFQHKLAPKPAAGGGSSYTPGGQSNALTISPAAHGSLTASPLQPRPGEVVTITGTPETGYQLATVTAQDALGKSLTLTLQGPGTYTLTMPNGQVRLQATFAKVGDKPAPAAAAVAIRSYVDVPAGQWYFPAVTYVSN